MLFKPSEHPFWNLWVLESAKEPCFRVKPIEAESYVISKYTHFLNTLKRIELWR